MPDPNFDSLVVISFGGPENPAEVIPFLENVLRGKNVPQQRLLEVAEHYYHFGGKSPINDQNRELVAAVRDLLQREGPAIPVYWGNRNWHPFLADTLRQMHADGCRRALAFATSAFSSYSGCRQYLEDIVRARGEIGEDAIPVEKLRIFYNHPRFIEAMTDRLRRAFEQAPRAELVFTAHSIPTYMAQTNDYEKQLKEACRLVAEQLGRSEWTLCYQSRSGPPNQPWLGPDIVETLRDVRSHGVRQVVVAPIGFISDHMEVLYDLDTEARAVCIELGLNMVRAGTVGVHPEMVAMVRELVMERLNICEPRAVGKFGPHTYECADDCCPGPVRYAPRLERVC